MRQTEDVTVESPTEGNLTNPEDIPLPMDETSDLPRPEDIPLPVDETLAPPLPLSHPTTTVGMQAITAHSSTSVTLFASARSTAPVEEPMDENSIEEQRLSEEQQAVRIQ